MPGEWGLTCTPSASARNLTPPPRLLLLGCHVSIQHLSSDYRGQKQAARNDQLGAILDLCRHWRTTTGSDEDVGGAGGGASSLPLMDVLLVGDFNCATECEDTESFSCLGEATATSTSRSGRCWTSAVDVWRACRPGEAGHTYDPTANALAAAHSPPGGPKPSKRCDRMVLLSGVCDAGSWAPVAVGLLGRDVASLGGSGDLSDHYGLWCELRRGDTPTTKSSEGRGSRGTTDASSNCAGSVVATGGERSGMRPQVDLILAALQRAVAAASQRLQEGPAAAARSGTGPTHPPLLPCCALIEMGATGLGVGVPGSSDVDVVCVGPWAASTFLGLVAAALRSSDSGLVGVGTGAPPVVRLVSAAAFVPVVKVTRIAGCVCGGGSSGGGGGGGGGGDSSGGNGGRGGVSAWWPSLDVQYVSCGALAADLVAWRGHGAVAAVAITSMPPIVDIFAAARLAQRHLTGDSGGDGSGALALEGITDGAALLRAIACAAAVAAATAPAAAAAAAAAAPGVLTRGAVSLDQSKWPPAPAAVVSAVAVSRLVQAVAVRVKRWALRRGVYGTAGGFPGGFAWTAMVAKLLQDESACSDSKRWRRWMACLAAEEADHGRRREKARSITAAGQLDDDDDDDDDGWNFEPPPPTSAVGVFGRTSGAPPLL